MIANADARPRWHLWGMIGLTVAYGILGLVSIEFGLLSFMCFDAGVTTPALIMFSISWLFPLGFWAGLILSWWGYAIRSRRLAITGMALPFAAFLIFCAYLVFALCFPNSLLVSPAPIPTK